MSVITQPVNTPEAWSLRAETEFDPWAACGWSQQSQSARFGKILDALKPTPPEWLLDWGCGTGDLAGLLPKGVGYLGFDWAAGMIDRANREYGGVTRRFRDREPCDMTFDLVACVGPFNLPDGWSKELTWSTIRRLYDGCRRAMAVSLYAGADGRCLIYTEDEVRRHMGGLAHDVRIERWRRNDILATVHR